MGLYDFTYQLPDNFEKRVNQYLIQYGEEKLAIAFSKCTYEYENLGLAYYAGLKGDNWNKNAIDFTIEGASSEIQLLKAHKKKMMEIIDKALQSSKSGLLIRNLFLLENEEMGIVLPESNGDRLNADIERANSILKDLIYISERVCSNYTYNESSNENCLNDFYRDMLSGMGYMELKDQTRHGLSESGNDAGEVDILLSKDNKEIALIEGLKLDSVNRSVINKHIQKAISNYNALGTPTFILAYVATSDFSSFWDRYYNYLCNYDFRITIESKVCELTYPNAGTRIANCVLSRDGFGFPVYFIAIKLMKSK